MTLPKNPAVAAKEARFGEAIEGIKSGLYKSGYHAARELKLPCTVLYSRLNGTRPRNKAHEDQQLLTHAEEKELLAWITLMLRAILWCCKWPNISVSVESVPGPYCSTDTTASFSSL